LKNLNSAIDYLSKKSWDFSDRQIIFEFSVNDQSFMSPLRAGYLQCAKNTLWNVQQSNTKKKF